MTSLPDKLCFVDIETTGASIKHDRIIEVGILRVENNKLVSKFESLVNPQMQISPFIENLTGIKRDELESAPTFGEIKEQIVEHLDGAVFVAHNVRFDYSFMKNEFLRYEIPFRLQHFCSVKLFRSLFPGRRHYDLDSLIDTIGVKVARRHRAFDDAKVIWEFYKRSLRKFSPELMLNAVSMALRRPNIPIGLETELLDNLPESPGVYIFRTSDGTPLYVGKSINIKDRVLSHFSGDQHSGLEMKISQQVKEIETIETEGELGALLLESKMIKDLQPIYNRKLRLTKRLVLVKSSLTSEGYKTIKIDVAEQVDANEIGTILGIYKSTRQAKEAVIRIAKEYKLCPQILGISPTSGKKGRACFYYHLGECEGACIGAEPAYKYNVKFIEAFGKGKYQEWPFGGPVVIKEGKEGYLVDKWCVVGSINKNNENQIDKLKRREYNFDSDNYKILAQFFKKQKNMNKVKVLRINN